MHKNNWKIEIIYVIFISTSKERNENKFSFRPSGVEIRGQYLKGFTVENGSGALPWGIMPPIPIDSINMRKILIATKNPGKILEYKEIFKNLPFEILTLKDLEINLWPEEDGKTFKENAIKKAKFYAKFTPLEISKKINNTNPKLEKFLMGVTNLPILAEDSGLEIDYLNGEPGIFSRRWPGYEASDEELIKMALDKLKGVPAEKRGAQLKVVIALVLPGKEIKTFEGILRGYIAEKPLKKIIPGYPFRTIFYVPKIDKILGELTMEEEARIAHRKEALRKAIPIIEKFLKSES